MLGTDFFFTNTVTCRLAVNQKPYTTHPVCTHVQINISMAKDFWYFDTSSDNTVSFSIKFLNI